MDGNYAARAIIQEEWRNNVKKQRKNRKGRKQYRWFIEQWTMLRAHIIFFRVTPSFFSCIEGRKRNQYRNSRLKKTDLASARSADLLCLLWVNLVIHCIKMILLSFSNFVDIWMSSLTSYTGVTRCPSRIPHTSLQSDSEKSRLSVVMRTLGC